MESRQRAPDAPHTEPAGALTFFLGCLGGRGANSNPIFPSGCLTRKAEKGRLLRLEINLCRRSVRPVVNSLVICSRSMVRCRMILPERKSHVRFGPVAFSQMKFIGCSKTRQPPL